MSEKETNEIELIDFPTEGCVYYVGVETKHGFLPFYVGQTKNLRRRMGEYYVVSYFTSTDFRVGTAIEHLQRQGKKVFVRFKTKNEGRRSEESKEKNRWRNILAEFGVELLNDSGYRPRKGKEREEHAKLKSEVTRLVDEFVTKVSSA